MNIIIDQSTITNDMREKYTVLELDTFRILPNGGQFTAYCVVENVPILELPLVATKKNLHENLLVNYRKRDWNFCNDAIDHLVGSWGGELDSFYNEMRGRIAKYIEQDPGDSWDGIVEKHITGS